MLHLSTERLASLGDAPLTLDEADHLARCPECAAGRAAYERLLAAAQAERHRIAPPLTDWASLSARLRAEGLVREQPAAPPVRRDRHWLRVTGRVAAALALVVGGGVAGRASAGAALLPGRGADARVVAAADSAVASDSADGYASAADALAALTSSQREYQRAAAFLAAHDSTAHEPDAYERYRTRLAALDDMAERSRRALYRAPQDPVINQYYLSTLGAREATLRQLGTALPVGARLTRF